MKRNTLFTIALLAGMAVNANAEKLYLSSIECTSLDSPSCPDFTFISLFQYDDNDNIIQIDINSHRNKELNEYMTLPESVTFKFGYDGKVLKNAKYSDSDGKTLEGAITTTDTDDGKIVETVVSGPNLASDKVFKTEYNNKGELIRYEASEDKDVDDNTLSRNYNNILYSYEADDMEDDIKFIYLSQDDNITNSCWTLQYGNNGILEKCGYTDFNILVNTPYISKLDFSYFNNNEFGEDTIVITPHPIQFIYDTLYENLYESMVKTHRLIIPECIACILVNQQNKIIKAISQDFCNFECKYQTERPTAGVEAVAADEDEAPTYFNIQGMPVSNPTEGEIYIVKHGNKATKEVYRR